MTHYLSYKESVAMLRASLKHNFPGVKFSVAKAYGRGDTVNVCYEFGPPVSAVDRIAQRFSGKDFDGMTDSTLYPKSLLASADGSVREVSHGVGYIFVHRNVPPSYLSATVCELSRRWSPDEWAAMTEWDRERLARPGIERLSVSPDESPEDFSKRAVASILSGPAIVS